MSNRVENRCRATDGWGDISDILLYNMGTGLDKTVYFKVAAMGKDFYISFYLFERQCNRARREHMHAHTYTVTPGKRLVYINCLTSERPTRARAQPGLGQEFGTPFRSHVCVAEFQGLEPHPPAPQEH